MKTAYCLVLGLVVACGLQATACSSDFQSCASSRSCGAGGSGAAGGDAIGEAGTGGTSTTAIGAGGSPDSISAGGSPHSAGAGGSPHSIGEAGEAGMAGMAGAPDLTPKLFGVCSTVGSIACVGAALPQRLACDGLKWQAGTTCAAGELCDSGTGKCAKAVPECADATPGGVVCRGDARLTCGPDLVTATLGKACAGLCHAGVCQDPTCGDNKLESGEDCDDGNTTTTDACTDRCKNAVCGDGSVYAGHEQCDDKNKVAGDGCSATCNWEPAAIAVGDHSCVLSGGGQLKCWGQDRQGALGLGTDSVNRGDDPNEMGNLLPVVSLGTNRTVKAIANDRFASCAILDHGDVKCWGANDYGNLGSGGFDDIGRSPGQMGDALAVVPLGTGRSAVALSLRGSHACAVLDNGMLKCWGSNLYGELGQGDTTIRGQGPDQLGDFLAPISLGKGRTAKAVAAGGTHTCALLDDATVKCWGGNASGQLGLGDHSDRGSLPFQMADFLPAVNLGTGRTAKAIAAGLDSTCAILDNGSVKCWGANAGGQLGLGFGATRGDEPDEMGDALAAVDLGTGRTAKWLSVGDGMACAVLDNGAVKCWGYNGSGQLGLGDTANRGDDPDEMGDSLPAVSLGTGRTAQQVNTADGVTCALLDNGTVKCWGHNGEGQLGLGDIFSRGDAPGQMGDNLPALNLTF